MEPDFGEATKWTGREVLAHSGEKQAKQANHLVRASPAVENKGAP